MDVHFPSLDITPLRDIYLIQAKIHFTNLGLYFSLEYFPAEFIHLAINTTQSKATTTKYQALGRFNRINMKIISTWD